MKKIFLFLIFALAFVSTKAQNFPSWLEGLWTLSQDDAHFSVFEEWKLQKENILLSKTYRIFGNDTIVFDEKKIFLKENIVILEMKVLNNNVSDDYQYDGEEIVKGIWKFSARDSVVPSAIYYRLHEDGSVNIWTEIPNDEEICTEMIMIRQR